MISKITIDESIKSIIPPLTEDEYRFLEASILTDGCRDPLILWNGTLLDGHNRYSICNEYKIPFATINRDFTDKTAAINWIVSNQLGRRNLTPVQKSLLIGTYYNEQKKPRGGARGNQHTKKLAKYQNDTLPASASVAEEIGHKLKVSRLTVIRDGKFADAFNIATKDLNEEDRRRIQAGDISLPKKSILELAKLPEAGRNKELDRILAGEKQPKASPFPSAPTSSLREIDRNAIDTIYELVRKLPVKSSTTHEVQSTLIPLMIGKFKLPKSPSEYARKIESLSDQVNTLMTNMEKLRDLIRMKDREIDGLNRQLSARTLHCSTECTYTGDRLGKEYHKVIAAHLREIYQLKVEASNPNKGKEETLTQMALNKCFTFLSEMEFMSINGILNKEDAVLFGRFLALSAENISSGELRKRTDDVYASCTKAGLEESVKKGRESSRQFKYDRIVVGTLLAEIAKLRDESKKPLRGDDVALKHRANGKCFSFISEMEFMAANGILNKKDAVLFGEFLTIASGFISADEELKKRADIVRTLCENLDLGGSVRAGKISKKRNQSAMVVI